MPDTVTKETHHLTAVATRMESLGRNCEFGFVQRHVGADPVSLLRWAGGPVEGVIAGLRRRWRGLMDEAVGRADLSDASPDEQFWRLTCRRYRITFHTEYRVCSSTAEEAAAKVRKRLGWAGCQAGFRYSGLRTAVRLLQCGVRSSGRRLSAAGCHA
jgi:hypothetical protein